ncbi:hypothetical protein [Streptomyces indiaensis]|uniref:hypothetical protein n=1 Tax=Streptomyces indiaensis TaxID=284033 RepID=UPI001F2A255D|nr:hypothetical protein [Streptomyces indiaensis]MCF1644680.1 hypothetical protein [Streptomyces indiaensis]
MARMVGVHGVGKWRLRRHALPIWDPEHRTTLDVIRLPGPCSAVSFSDDGLPPAPSATTSACSPRG